MIFSIRYCREPTAYLYCFDYWGYEFVFSRAGQLFRDVLNDKREFPVPVPTLWYDNKVEIHKVINIPTGIVMMNQFFIFFY